jgi:hypothetical protein
MEFTSDEFFQGNCTSFAGYKRFIAGSAADNVSLDICYLSLILCSLYLFLIATKLFLEDQVFLFIFWDL